MHLRLHGHSVQSDLFVHVSRIKCFSLNGFLSFRCAEHHINYIRCQEEIIQSVKSAENSLLHFISQKVTCLADCTDQATKLRVRNSYATRLTILGFLFSTATDLFPFLNLIS